MLQVTDVGLRFGDKELYKDVNIKFTKGNCYGIIGANGAGKSTFLKILSGEIEPNTGSVSITDKERMSVLKQDHFEYDQVPVIDTVIMGHERLWKIMKEKDALYMKEDFSDEDGIKAAELEGEFAELDGWDAETNAEKILMGLGIEKDLHYSLMNEISGGEKVKVLLAQALFGKPEILLLDEPTNHLDYASIKWLNEFIINLDETIVIVVSHDRHFLNTICTHIVDVDFGKIKLYTGNYDFWYESSQLALQLMKDQNKKAEEKIAQLKEFIARFSSNASKAKQATSRKKQLEKLNIEEIQPSRRKYPYVAFKPEREIGNEVLELHNITKEIDGVKVLNDISFRLDNDDKVVFLGDDIATTALFDILSGKDENFEGSFKWGVTTSNDYMPKNHNEYFDGCELSLVDWLRQFSEEKSESYIRGFLGRMLFSGDEALKEANVLSGGEKVRCMLSKLMLSNSNVLILDDPTNHLDLESITSVNKALEDFKGVLLFSSHDHQFISSIANRIIFIGENGIVDRKMDFEEFIESDEIQELLKKIVQS
ncbi:ABC-F family ATP-binding cassette domain-containing protein [Peptostreptococcus porci]|uniref:ABC-F family ATP-binding cassette domain-containing protein n=1 Tax=Peptostreptococcus porci TaxID=2652282 RepID=UPI0023F507AB|nr:ATP-binding cassette domain-containing protein [Peptostreptococcus porci]MDD7183841.1 ATP-binding cassette domain-containing protein [Peptostreptococcus porci]MDY2794001.1 ATP-binding cassette domain-containing protein [Peptostreptococcus porci]MDY4560963.1 ATP-binding cassette domain-containing protein [Peptostreptococcus porci]MDY5435390.1 ATP-binding cassette domain-containing protein [Peptostreptococcus porci]MDY6231959.1 ATP-binding cassette domain-containing protein [Peptostreptococcu